MTSINKKSNVFVERYWKQFKSASIHPLIPLQGRVCGCVWWGGGRGARGGGGGVINRNYNFLRKPQTIIQTIIQLLQSLSLSLCWGSHGGRVKGGGFPCTTVKSSGCRKTNDTLGSTRSCTISTRVRTGGGVGWGGVTVGEVQTTVSLSWPAFRHKQEVWRKEVIFSCSAVLWMRPQIW